MASPSMVPDSDTASVSSDIRRLSHVPPRHRPPTPSDAASRDTVPCGLASSPHPSTPVPFPPAPAAARGPVRRKPLSSTAASPLALPHRPALLLTSPLELHKPGRTFARPLSASALGSRALHHAPSSSVRASAPPCGSPARPGPAHAATPEPRSIPSDHHQKLPLAELSHVLCEYDDLVSGASASAPDAARDGTSPNALDESSDDVESLHFQVLDQNTSPPPILSPKPIPPHLTLNIVDTSVTQHERQHSPGLQPLESANLNKPLPKSPSQSSPFASLFSWGYPSPSVTDFSSVSSPSSSTRNGSTDDTPNANKSLSETTPNAKFARSNPINYCESYLSTPPPPQAASSAQVEEMEEELKAISAELAASIRREMDLEDLVERLQEQASNPQAPCKRTSDYFSDSGYSSAKLSEPDQSREEVERIQRRSEQEKASIRLELTSKLQDERSKRKALDLQIKELAEKASHMDLAQVNSLDANDRVRGLENACEDLRRRLSEERQSKDNFEDLLSALKGELQDACNERDNLRDEVVPQLRARVEGLESEASSYVSLTYESTKMQQQLQSLQKENTSLRNSSGGASEHSGSLSGSNSAAATGSLMPRGPSAPSGLSRSDSTKNAPVESREQLAERLKDVEAQRDALHGALRNLLERQELQNRENEKRIRVLEIDRQRLLSDSPAKAGFAKDITNLRTEINVLRRRAEDALEHKWQMEKGLVGLKMDLDRAEEEIASLRGLLKEKDILIPPSMARSSSSSGTPGVPVTSESLEKAYRELQEAYKGSLERIKKLELDAGSGASDETNKPAIRRLEHSLRATISERDAARQQVDDLQGRVSGLIEIESSGAGREKTLADELGGSAQRVEQLASQVRQQLSTNAELRDRLSDAVARGEAERKANADRISGLQERLHVLEEQLIAAQTASEDQVRRHEEDISRLREANNGQLRRINGGTGGGMTPAAQPTLKSGVSKWFFSSAVPTKSLEESSQIKTLQARVGELEKALADAESEIQQVVAKMSTAQIQVLNLQEEREAAVRETRRLQNTLVDEQSKAFGERFKTLDGIVV